MKNKGSSTFDELKRQLKNLEKDIQIKQYDYSSNETNVNVKYKCRKTLI